jgi:hypothetical protein
MSCIEFLRRATAFFKTVILSYRQVQDDETWSYLALMRINGSSSSFAVYKTCEFERYLPNFRSSRAA